MHMYSLKVDSRAPLLLVTAEFEVLASLQDELVLCLAGGTFETEDDLLGLEGFGQFLMSFPGVCEGGDWDERARGEEGE